MKNKIVVCHVIHSFDFGGIQKLLYDLVSSQRMNNLITVNILVIKKNGEFLSRFQSLDVDILSLGVKKIYFFGFNNIIKTIKVFKKSDIVHFHNFNPFISIIPFIYKKSVIYTEHGNFAFGRKKSMVDYILIKMRIMYFKFFPIQIIANSNFTKSYLKKTWNVYDKKITTIHNGVKLIGNISQKNVNFIRKQYKNRFIIGTTSRLAGFKRIDRLIKSFKLINRNNNNVVLLIIGDGIEKLSLQKLVENENINNVHFLGYKENVYDYQSAFDVCVFPSNNEPFGLVAVESYFLNKPTLVFKDGGGIKEIVSMVNKNDIVQSEEDLAERIQYYIDNDIKSINNTNVLNYFSAKRMEQDYFRCYTKYL